MSTRVKLRKSNVVTTERRRRPRTAPGFPSKRGQKLVDGLSRSELVRKYDYKVRAEAWKIAKRGPNLVDVDDLVSMGFLGLMDAADKFDPGRGVKFETYAEYRIRGAILDELRKQDWVPRSARMQAREMEHAALELEEKKHEKPTDREVSRRLGVSLKKYQRMRRDLGSLTMVHYENIESLPEHEDQVFSSVMADGELPDLFSEMNRKEAKELLDKLFEELDEEERVILSCYYYRGLNQAEIGQILDLSESRISQLHKQAIVKLKRHLASKATTARRLFLMLFEA